MASAFSEFSDGQSPSGAMAIPCENRMVYGEVSNVLRLDDCSRGATTSYTSTMFRIFWYSQQSSQR